MADKRALQTFEAALKRSLSDALELLDDLSRSSSECAEILEDHANRLLSLSYDISEARSDARRRASDGGSPR